MQHNNQQIDYVQNFQEQPKVHRVEFHNKALQQLQIPTIISHDMTPPCRHQLQLQDPRIVNLYNAFLMKQLIYHKIPAKVSQLKQIAEQRKWTSMTTQQYNRIDKLITEAMLHAEKRSCKKYMSMYA